MDTAIAVIAVFVVVPLIYYYTWTKRKKLFKAIAEKLPGKTTVTPFSGKLVGEYDGVPFELSIVPTRGGDITKIKATRDFGFKMAIYRKDFGTIVFNKIDLTDEPGCEKIVVGALAEDADSARAFLRKPGIHEHINYLLAIGSNFIKVRGDNIYVKS